MKEYLEKIGYASAATIYLFICGALYNFFYWSFFNFDITNLVTIADIPKSIFSAMFFSIGTVGLSSVLGYVLIHKGPKSRFWNFSLFMLLTSSFIIWMAFSIYFSVILVLTDLTVIAAFIFFHKKLFDYVNEDKSTLIAVLLIIPFFCSMFGLLCCGSIRNNSNRTSYVGQIRSTDSLLIKNCIHKKLLGYIGDKVILSDLDNSNFIVVNQTAFNSITFITDTSLFSKTK